MIYILDIWKIILNLLDFKSQINLISLNHIFRNELKITNLYDIEEKYLKLLTDDILKMQIFNQVNSLNANNNKKITNVSMIKSLKKLNASYNCGIDQNGIVGLDLVELNAGYNGKIKNV